MRLPSCWRSSDAEDAERARDQCRRDDECELGADPHHRGVALDLMRLRGDDRVDQALADVRDRDRRQAGE